MIKSHSLQIEAESRCHYNSYRWFQRGNRDIQEREIQCLGRRRTGQDQAAMETLLLWFVIQSEAVDHTEQQSGTQGLIFVIDSNDRARIDEARQELHRIILDREMNDALLLVFANKQDVDGGKLEEPLYSLYANVYMAAMSPQEVQERLKLSQLKDKTWFVVPSCATTGEGIFEGLVSATISVQTKYTDIMQGLALEQR